MKRFLLAVLGAAVLSSGCAVDDDREECVGELSVTVRVASVPDKLRILWEGEVVIDECAGLLGGRILYERRAGELLISDGGFGFRPPSRLDVEVVDQRDCILPAVSLVVARDQAIPGAPFEVCERADVLLDP